MVCIKDYKSLELLPSYEGPVSVDYYGRLHPRHSNGTVRLPICTNSLELIAPPVLEQFDRKTDHRLLYRRLGLCAEDVRADDGAFQSSLFVDYEALEREKRIQGAMLRVREKYGKSAVFKGMNLLDGAMTLERNKQIGGHKA